MKRFILPLLLFSSLMMPNERFKNTNEEAAGKSFRDFLKWTFTNKKPQLVAIDSSDEWKELDSGSTDYMVWICLLYTSPSPRDVEESRMPSSA